MMDSTAYSQNAFNKLQIYACYGILPTINLITTYETKEHPLNAQTVQQLITHYFLQSRFISILGRGKITLLRSFFAPILGISHFLLHLFVPFSFLMDTFQGKNFHSFPFIPLPRVIFTFQAKFLPLHTPKTSLTHCVGQNPLIPLCFAQFHDELIFSPKTLSLQSAFSYLYTLSVKSQILS